MGTDRGTDRQKLPFPYDEAPAEAEYFLPDEELDRALRLVMNDSYYSQSMVTLTTGVFLVGFAVQYQASNVFIGLLAAIPFFAQLVQIPAIRLVEHYQSRRGVTIWATLIYRLFLLPIVLIPFLPDAQWALPVLLASMICQFSVNAVSLCAWNSWLRDLIPVTRLGQFFSRKILIATAITAFLTLLGGLFLDFWAHRFPDDSVYGYTILFLAAMIIGVVGVAPLAWIPEPPYQGGKHLRLLDAFREPLADKQFQPLIVFMASWNFAINLAAPFFTVYMLKTLGFSMAMVTAMTIASQFANLLSLRIWGVLADRFSNKSVLSVSAPLFVFCLLGWTFTTMPDPHALAVPMAFALHILLGIATAGVTLGNGNIALKLAPREKATTYLAANSIAASIAAGLAPMIGGLFADFFASQELALVIHWQGVGGDLSLQTLNFHHWDFFFFFAFLLGQYSLHRLAMVHESGDVDDKIIWRELVVETRRSFHNLSSIYGLRNATSFSFSMFRRARRLSGKPKKKSL